MTKANKTRQRHSLKRASVLDEVYKRVQETVTAFLLQTRDVPLALLRSRRSSRYRFHLCTAYLLLDSEMYVAWHIVCATTSENCTCCANRMQRAPPDESKRRAVKMMASVRGRYITNDGPLTFSLDLLDSLDSRAHLTASLPLSLHAMMIML